MTHAIQMSTLNRATLAVVAMLIAIAAPVQAMTSQDVSSKLDDITFEAGARKIAYFCGGKSFGDAFTRDSKQYVKLTLGKDAEQRIAGTPVTPEVSREACPGLMSQMKELQQNRNDSVKILQEIANKESKAK
ncbi:hypothetical protein SAMN04488595_11869 [Ralstonia sp. 25mfcol4.1]|uniref:hypothetical protein n=1 Tax=Ralstonia sp. 25mfcol4.1 TaxID=1761899 RepID=UPI00048E8103|nr:hypothetical protein [Ralstonia sp. 25mfcol4.1]SDP72623.1 hypothetical protein SAMN04488595_11869 [Ralstonia sp. 25mfcol4.1]